VKISSRRRGVGVKTVMTLINIMKKNLPDSGDDDRNAVDEV
jgi:hypothetical protein